MTKIATVLCVTLLAVLLISAGIQDSRPASAWPPAVQKGAKALTITLAAPPGDPLQAIAQGRNARILDEHDRLLIGVEVLDVQANWALLTWTTPGDLKAPLQTWINVAQVVNITK